MPNETGSTPNPPIPSGPPAVPPPVPRNVRPAATPSPGMPGWAIALIICGCLLAFLFVAGILAGLLLPALAVAKQKAQIAVCENNLKQIGLAIRVWAGDHNDQLPMNVSTNQGGVRELCSPGPDGFDRNPWLLFQAISNELNSPQMLVAPGDTTKQPAADFQHLQAGNVSYQIVSRVSDSPPGAVLIYYPHLRVALFTDGSVQRLTPEQAQQFLISHLQQR